MKRLLACQALKRLTVMEAQTIPRAGSSAAIPDCISGDSVLISTFHLFCVPDCLCNRTWNHLLEAKRPEILYTGAHILSFGNVSVCMTKLHNILYYTLDT